MISSLLYRLSIWNFLGNTVHLTLNLLLDQTRLQYARGKNQSALWAMWWGDLFRTTCSCCIHLQSLSSVLANQQLSGMARSSSAVNIESARPPAIPLQKSASQVLNPFQTPSVTVLYSSDHSDHHPPSSQVHPPRLLWCWVWQKFNPSTLAASCAEEKQESHPNMVFHDLQIRILTYKDP